MVAQGSDGRCIRTSTHRFQLTMCEENQSWLPLNLKGSSALAQRQAVPQAMLT